MFSIYTFPSWKIVSAICHLTFYLHDSVGKISLLEVKYIQRGNHRSDSGVYDVAAIDQLLHSELLMAILCAMLVAGIFAYKLSSFGLRRKVS